MESLSITNLLMVPILCAALSALLGIKLAYLRTLARGTGWITFDVLVLLPAFLPVHLLGHLFEGLLGDRSVHFLEIWPIVATIIVSTPFSYLPARIAFACIDRKFHDTSRLIGMNIFQRALLVEVPLAWPALVTGWLLATARALGEFAGAISAGFVLLLVIVPTAVAAILMAQKTARPVS